MESGHRIELSRDCEVIEIPGGRTVQVTTGTPVSITQALGGSYTLLIPSMGGLFRLAARDADAIGREVEVPEAGSAEADGATGGGAPKSVAELRDQVWAALKTCFDPEIPVNIVDLGLIYALDIDAREEGGHRVGVKMTLTAQGCGMGASIAGDAQSKIERIPGVSDALVEVVWDPPWTPEKISEAGRTVLGMG
jgi:probable FeS assembly SUF system protein SufT